MFRRNLQKRQGFVTILTLPRIIVFCGSQGIGNGIVFSYKHLPTGQSHKRKKGHTLPHIT